MTQPATEPATEANAVLKNLNDLVVHCAELRELEKLPANFNLLGVLRFEPGELRHSNKLACLLQPEHCGIFVHLFGSPVNIDTFEVKVRRPGVPAVAQALEVQA